MSEAEEFVKKITEIKNGTGETRIKKLADKMAEYILDTEDKREYENFCQDKGIDPKEKNCLDHIYGIALEYIGDTL